MSLVNCLQRANKGKRVFASAEIQELQALAAKNRETMAQAEAEAATVQALLDEAIAEQGEVQALILEAAPALGAKAEARPEVKPVEVKAEAKPEAEPAPREEVAAVEPAPAEEAKPEGVERGATRFSRMSAKLEQQRDLVIQHNLTVENLMHAANMGGIPVPSLAVTKADAPMVNFGEITLIGPEAMADPKGYAGTKVFGADIYSPRYPSVEFKLDNKAQRKMNEALAPFRQDGDREMYGGEVRRPDDLTSYKPFKRWAADRYGVAENATSWSQLSAAANAIMRDIGAGQRIFQGFTYSGNRRYIDHTLDNVVKILKKELRGGENFNYGVGSLRAKFTPQFRSVDAIRKAKDRLVTKDAFEAVKKEIDGEFIALSNDLELSLEQTIEVIEDAAKMGAMRSLKRAFKDYRSDQEPTVDQAIAVGDFARKLESLPTAYFEAKILRAVDVAEFKAAVVPDDMPAEARAYLESRGVKVVDYERGNDADRAAKIKQAAADNDAMFSRAPQTNTAAFKKWFGASKVVDAQGEPLVVYHGTRGDITTFDAGKVKVRFPNSEGFYFTSKPLHASVYADSINNAAEDFNPNSRFVKPVAEGGNVMPAYVSLQNPKILTVSAWGTLESRVDGDGGAQVRAAREAGHDGVIVKREAGDEWDGMLVIAFRPEQIKSATGNNGDFDSASADITYSRNANTRLGIPMRDANAVAQAVRESLPTAPQILLHESLAQAPQKLQDAINAAGAANDVEAAYHDGAIHVFPQHMASVERMAFVVGHHEIRHHGLRSMLGPRLGPVLLGMHQGNANLRAAAQAKIDEGLTTSRVEAIEEALADMPLEDLAKLNGWDKIVTAVRQWLRNLAAKLRRTMPNLADAIDPMSWTDRDVAAMVMRAENVSRGGSGAFRTGGTVFQRAWHGTPYRGIDKFSTDAIGTGEGAQAYGYGLYFASKREVADFYRRKLAGESGRVFTKDGRTIQGSVELAEAYYQPGRIVRGYSGADKVLEFKRTEGGGWGVKVIGVRANGEPMQFERPRWHSTQPDGNALRDVLEEDGWKPSQAGQLYEVEIPEDSELLLWDKPLSEQPANVRQALQKVLGGELMDADGKKLLATNPDAKGSKLYGLLGVSDNVSGERGASQALLDAGIKGIKYLDGTSRDGKGNGHNYVIFSGEDTAIKGTMFSRTTAGAAKLTAQDLVNSTGGVFDFNRMGENKQDRLRTVMDGSRPFWLGALTRDQIADIYGKEISPVKEYDQLTRDMENQRSKIAQDADDIYSEWAKLPAEENDKLARMMLDATVYSVHPDGAFNATGAPNDAERRQVHARLKAQYALMGKDAKAMYSKVRDFHLSTLTQLRDGLLARVDRQVENGAAKAAALTKIRTAFDAYLKEGPYFPLSRFGDFLVIANHAEDGERVVASYATAGEQAAAARTLEADGFTVKMKTAKTYSRETDGSAGKFIGDVLTTLDKLDMADATVGGDVADLKTKLMDDVNQLFIKALPDLSYRKHFMHRKGTPGFSSDMMRGFASSSFHAASHIARLNHGDKMTFALQDAYSAIEQISEGDFNLHSQVLNELTKRHDAALNPNTHPIAAMLNQVGFVMYLGMSPAAGIINMLQTVMVTMPHLGARYGFGKANGSLAKALSDITTGAKANAKNGWNAAQSTKLTAAERSMMSALQDEGVIDLTQAHDLASATGLDTGNVARSKAAFAMARAMKIVGWTFHIPEVMNRQVTALSAYRLELEKSGNEDAAKDAAREAIKRTHFDYSSSNRARFMQGNVARVMLQFKQYGQNMTYLLGRAAYQALKGESPEVRSIARRQLVATFGVTWAMAGTLGLPGIGSIAGLIGALVGAMDDDDEPWDWKVEFRNLMADQFGKEAGEVISHGIPRALMPWDISNRVSLGDLWWRDNGREGQNPREAFASDMSNILGPTAGTVLGLYTAADHMAKGNWSKATEAMVPKFLRDPLKALREGTEGVTSYAGEPLMDTTAAETMGRLLGFSPARASEMFEGKNAVMNAKTAIEQKRQALIGQMAKARIDKDAETVAELQPEIAAFNQRNPEFRITGATIAKATMTRMKNRKNTEDGILLPRTKQSLRDIGRFAEVD